MVGPLASDTIMEPPNESRYSLEAKLIYAAVVAGKSAGFADRVTGRLLDIMGEQGYPTPFAALRSWAESGRLGWILRDVRAGSYGRLTHCFSAVCRLDLESATLDELEGVHGIGPKTARFWLMWTRPEARYAALDTHVLKYLRSLGHRAPKSTPSAGPEYRRLEEAFLAEADRQGKTARDLDYEVWSMYAEKGQLRLPLEVAP